MPPLNKARFMHDSALAVIQGKNMASSGDEAVAQEEDWEELGLVCGSEREAHF